MAQASANSQEKDSMFHLSPKSSKFIRELRDKKGISINSLTYDESQALREHKTKEKEARREHIKIWHQRNIRTLYEISGKHALSNRDDFQYDALQLLRSYTKKRKDRLTELREERLKRIKTLSLEEQQAYGHHVMPVDQTPFELALTDSEITDYLTDGLQRSLKDWQE